VSKVGVTIRRENGRKKGKRKNEGEERERGGEKRERENERERVIDLYCT
jgi:hypothetical protein